MRILILPLLLLSSCSLYTPEQRVVMDDGRVYSSEVISGTLIEIQEPDGTKVLIDRRGRPSIMEDVLKVYAIGKADD